MTYSQLANPRATKEVLRAFGHDPKYKLGQNFLIDDNVVGNILDLAQLEEDAGTNVPTVLEIGPGIGTLTIALLRCARVVAVERDASLAPVLAQTTAPDAERFALLQGDALKVTCAQVADACAQIDASLPHMLVANLPYQVAATVILDWFARFDFIDTMVVMVQSEVADRICAQPGCKDYGAYTVKLALRACPAGRFQVPPSCFMPAPHVTSSVIRLERRDDVQVAHIGSACVCADAAFAQRRKNIRNSMCSRFDACDVNALLGACGINPSMRAETLEPRTFLELGAALDALRV